MHNKIRVTVLVATYNGEAYLDEQLKSIQDSIDYAGVDGTIIVRDDSSIDGTKKVIQKFATEATIPFITLDDSRGNIGVKRSFYALVKAASDESDFYFFSDQDDVWNIEKVRIMVDALVDSTVNVPTGVFSDLWISDSMAKSTGKKMSERTSWPQGNEVSANELLFDYVVTGAALAINKVAREEILKVSETDVELANMHDSFFGLLLASKGRLLKIDEPLVNYRQHDNNVVGVKKKWDTPWQLIDVHRQMVQQFLNDGLVLRKYISQEVRNREGNEGFDLIYDFMGATVFFKRMITLRKLKTYLPAHRRVLHIILLIFSHGVKPLKGQNI